MEISAFGTFGVVWALVVLVEGMLLAYFGDIAVGILARCSEVPETEARGAVVILSTAASATVGAAMALAYCIYHPGQAQLAVGAALLALVIAARLLAVSRKILHAVHNRFRAAVCAIFYLALIVTATAFPAVTFASVASTLGALAVVSLVAASTCLFLGPALSRPCSATLKKLFRAISSAGHGVALSTLLSWSGNLGLLPLIGALLGLPAAAQFRIAQTLASPPSQYTIATQSMLVATNRPVPFAHRVALHTIGPAVYAVLVLSFGTLILDRLFGTTGSAVPLTLLAVTLIGYACESIKFAHYSELIAAGKTKNLPAYQAASLAALAAMLPIGMQFGLVGIAACCATANNLPSIIILAMNVRTVSRTT